MRGSGAVLPLHITTNAPNPCMIKFRTGLCYICHLGFGMEAVLPRLGSRAPPNFPNCSVRFLKTGIVESSWKLLVQLYFHYPELYQNWIQKTGSFLILDLIYELKKFLQSALRKEKAGFPSHFSLILENGSSCKIQTCILPSTTGLTF